MLSQESYHHRRESVPRKIGHYFPLFKKSEHQKQHETVYGKRGYVIDRDKCCQVQGCDSEMGLQVHHIVPNCLINERETNVKHGTYNSYFLLKYQQILDKYGILGDTTIKEKLALRIEHITNLLLVCSKHHVDIHRPKRKSFFLKKPNTFILRPKSLYDEDVMGFFYVMIEETLLFSNINKNMLEYFTDYFNDRSTLRELLYFL